MMHTWISVEGGEWCRQCGTLRGPARQEFDPISGESLGEYFQVFQLGSDPKKVRVQDFFGVCQLLPTYFQDAIHQWLSIRERWGHSVGGADGFHADMGHSALLQRILTRGKIFSEPPPRSHSYPHYSLLDEGVAEPISVWFMGPEDVFAQGESSVVIDQSRWKLLQILGTNEYLVTYYVPDAVQIQEYQNEGKSEPEAGWKEIPSKSRWRLQLVGSRVYFGKNGVRWEMNPDQKSLNELWRLTRMPERESLR